MQITKPEGQIGTHWKLLEEITKLSVDQHILSVDQHRHQSTSELYQSTEQRNPES